MSVSHGKRELMGLAAYCNPNHHHHEGDRFGRLFPDLPPLFTGPGKLNELGKAGGIMDDLNNNTRTDTVAVGQVFFGQFVDHDITLDVSSSLDTVNNPAEIVNVRTPTLDLDCVYGAGPEAMPFLFHSTGEFRGVKLITGADAGDGPHAADDLPRIGEVAVIGDFRNDENRALSQIQLAMLRFHNGMVDRVHGDHPELEGKELYEEARKLCMWHYQWAVVHDFLAQICGEGVVNRVLTQGRKHYCSKTAFIPVEFSVAAYRFGHSMVPMKIQVQTGEAPLSLFGDVLGRGFESIKDPRAAIDLHELFDTREGRQTEKTGKLDTKLSSDLLQLPSNVDNQRRSLASRNLLRGQSFLLPSGEEVARRLERPETEISQIAGASGLNGGTPLWFYILKEAELIGREEIDGTRSPGEGLGPIGATIVAETIIGLIELDPRSWLSNDRSWTPSKREDDDTEISTVGEILTFA